MSQDSSSASRSPRSGRRLFSSSSESSTSSQHSTARDLAPESPGAALGQASDGQQESSGSRHQSPLSAPSSQESLSQQQQIIGQEGTEDAESQSSQRVGAGHSPPRSQLTESSALHYGSEFDVSSHIGSTALSQRSAPRHVRADINCAPSHHRTIRIDNMEDDLVEGGGGGEGGTTRLYIWGTRICVYEVQCAFRRFVMEYKPSAVSDDENVLTLPTNLRMEIDLERPYYLERLYEIDQSESIAFNDIIPYLDLTVNEIFAEKYQKVLYSPIEVRPFNAEKTRNMRALNPGDVDQLITISGMVTRKSPPIPEMRQAYFQCNTCNFSVIFLFFAALEICAKQGYHGANIEEVIDED
ncbi:unnamed protein product [Gongylonema pulchrum]|uniref:MCM_OB domain-containing protein n=1 Tax=Gongylonema pulchrum TaxID=637853 RepID=A0A183E9P5_9BILA|nr:unnamed protein product [Gongylonema pulchrum]